MKINLVSEYIVKKNKSGKIHWSKLNKLLFYSQASSLAYNYHPLFNDEPIAKQFGIFYDELNYIYKHLSFVTKKDIKKCNLILEENEKKIIDDAMSIYGKKSDYNLMKSIKNELPYRIAFNNKVSNKISINLMREYYCKIIFDKINDN